MIQACCFPRPYPCLPRCGRQPHLRARGSQRGASPEPCLLCSPDSPPGPRLLSRSLHPLPAPLPSCGTLASVFFHLWDGPTRVDLSRCVKKLLYRKPLAQLVPNNSPNVYGTSYKMSDGCDRSSLVPRPSSPSLCPALRSAPQLLASRLGPRLTLSSCGTLNKFLYFSGTQFPRL